MFNMAEVCASCGQEVALGDKFCGSCGAPISQTSVQSNSGGQETTSPGFGTLYFSPNGRLSPRKFIISALKMIGFFLVLIVILSLIDPFFGENLIGLVSALQMADQSIAAIFYLMIIYPVSTWVAWCLSVKRFHDFDKSMTIPTLITLASIACEIILTGGVIYVVSMLGIGYLAILALIPGNPDGNQYGPSTTR